MEDKLKDLCSSIYVGLSMTSLDVLREDMGLARAIEISSKVWQRFGMYIAPVLAQKYQLTEKSIPNVAAVLNSFLKDALCFQSAISETSANKAIIVIKPCFEWNKFKEARLPPLCYRMCYSMVESIIKQLNPEIKFQPGAQMRQGADRCEFILMK